MCSYAAVSTILVIKLRILGVVSCFNSLIWSAASRLLVRPAIFFISANLFALFLFGLGTRSS